MKFDNSQLLSDLFSLYKSLIREHPCKTRREICILISQSPAPRMYFSVEYARRVISVMSLGGRRSHDPIRFRKHHELYRRWLSLPINEQNIEGLQNIISQPAPSFYLSPDRINYLLYKAIEK